MGKFTIVVTQQLIESAWIEVEADSLENAKEIVRDSIKRDALEQEFDPDWGGDYTFLPDPGFGIDEEETDAQADT